MAEEHNGEKDYEPTEKKMTRSKQEEVLQSGSHFHTLIRRR